MSVKRNVRVCGDAVFTFGSRLGDGASILRQTRWPRKTRVRREFFTRLVAALAMIKWPINGEMAEWSKAPDSKSGLGQPNGGSNPSLSATFQNARRGILF